MCFSGLPLWEVKLDNVQGMTLGMSGSVGELRDGWRLAAVKDGGGGGGGGGGRGEGSIIFLWLAALWEEDAKTRIRVLCT